MRKPQENHWLSCGCLIWAVQRRVRAVGWWWGCSLLLGSEIYRKKIKPKISGFGRIHITSQFICCFPELLFERHSSPLSFSIFNENSASRPAFFISSFSQLLVISMIDNMCIVHTQQNGGKPVLGTKNISSMFQSVS